MFERGWILPREGAVRLTEQGMQSVGKSVANAR